MVGKRFLEAVGVRDRRDVKEAGACGTRGRQRQESQTERSQEHEDT
jgi:hypothetical protein